MMVIRRTSYFTLPFGIQEIFPSFWRLRLTDQLFIVGREYKLIGEAHRAVVVLNRFWIDTYALVVKGLMHFFHPQGRMMGVCHHHQIPFGWDAGGTQADDFTDISGHVSRGTVLQLNVEAVFLVESCAQRLRTLGCQRGWSVEFDGSLLLGTLNEIVDGCGTAGACPDGDGHQQDKIICQSLHTLHEIPPLRHFRLTTSRLPLDKNFRRNTWPNVCPWPASNGIGHVDRERSAVQISSVFHWAATAPACVRLPSHPAFLRLRSA